MTKYLFALILLLSFNDTIFAQNLESSVLSEGDIFKFSVKNTGIYKIDYEQLSSISDLDISNINPKNIHIYSQHGGLVPQIIAEERIDDLSEISIYIKGEEDNSFDPGDYILIYLEGADRFVVKNQLALFEKNIYDLKNFFFLKVENNPGKRIATNKSISANEYSDYTESIRRHEVDRLNLLGNFGSTQGSGKRWFGESFANNPLQTFDKDFTFLNLRPGSITELEVRFASRSLQSANYEVTVDGESFLRSISPTNTGDIEAVYARIGFLKESIDLNSTQPNVSIRYLPKTSNSEAWLDYIQMISIENLNYSGQEMYLFRRDSRQQTNFGFDITSNQNLSIWNITKQNNVFEITPEQNGSSIKFAYETEGEVKVFVAFDKSSITNKAQFESKIENQNLHGIDRADLIIVYYKDFKTAAVNLAEHRTNYDKLVAVTVDVDQIYNEFGGGKKDPTAVRDFVKMIYERDPNFRYLCLFGDASYDYRGLVNGLEYQNFVPTYETNESLHPVEAFPSDDFFALLSNNEGEDSLDGALDIGVGRIPCKTITEANNVVNKIINYDISPTALGDWRMRIGFAADDEDSNTHVRQADGIAELTAENHPEIIQQKVYFDAFNQESTPGGARYPDANSALNDNLLKGQLVLNYLGHGGPKGWAQERVFQVGDIINLKNFDKLPVLITATCSFTGFDEPSVVSAGELALLNPIGGAIALFSTVRAVYSSQNERITKEVFKKIFTRNEGDRLRLGDIIRMSQNANSSDTISSNTRKFMLFGDPAQTIALPRYKVIVNQFNDMPIDTGRIDTIGALQKTKLSGIISDFSDNIINDFNGTVSLSVFDKTSKLKTLDNDGIGRTFEFNSRKNILYKGSASVRNGRFEIEFILPKDINFDYGKGFLNFYASNGVDADAGGAFDNIIIGGTSGQSISDNEGPDISIYLNDRSFIEGGKVGSNSILIVDLEDDNGISLSSTSIGHDITAIIDGNSNNPIVLNEFYTPTSDAIGKGTVNYNLSNLDPGNHTITIKAWDILNNSSFESSSFIVVDGDEGFINNIKNFPNPFHRDEGTTFSFEHDLINTNIDYEIEIYNSTGALVETIKNSQFSFGSTIVTTPWNGNSYSSQKFAEGIYFYKIKISSKEFNQRRESDFEKLVIVR